MTWGGGGGGSSNWWPTPAPAAPWRSSPHCAQVWVHFPPPPQVCVRRTRGHWGHRPDTSVPLGHAAVLFHAVLVQAEAALGAQSQPRREGAEPVGAAHCNVAERQDVVDRTRCCIANTRGAENAVWGSGGSYFGGRRGQGGAGGLQACARGRGKGHSPTPAPCAVRVSPFRPGTPDQKHRPAGPRSREIAHVARRRDRNGALAHRVPWMPKRSHNRKCGPQGPKEHWPHHFRRGGGGEGRSLVKKDFGDDVTAADGRVKQRFADA